MSGGPLSWWPNRKSRLGLSPVAKEPPPKSPGQPWWTTPPIAPPQPEHIEFAVRFQRELVTSKHQTARKQRLAKYVADWLKEAKRLLHESIESDDGELHTTDGLFIATHDMLHELMSKATRAGVPIDPRWRQIQQAVSARAYKALRERAIRRGA